MMYCPIKYTQIFKFPKQKSENSLILGFNSKMGFWISCLIHNTLSNTEILSTPKAKSQCFYEI